MKTYNAGEMVVAGIVGAVLAIGTVQAGTVLWYRFDGNGATIENKASPGTMDGTLKSINTWGSLGGLGDTAAKFPTRGDAFPEGTRLVDPASDAVQPTVKSLTFTGDPANSGTVRLLKADTTTAFKELMSFTCEVFFKLPSDSAAIETRRAKDILFPLVDWGSPDGGGRGWFLGLRKDSSSTGFYPFLRTKHYTGTEDQRTDVQWQVYINDSNWHHMAVRATADETAHTASIQLLLDYTVVASGNLNGFYGFHYNNTGNFPFLVGADLWRSSKSCCFMGEIAEVRVSDTALAADKLLRPLPAGPVDDDTLVYLPMGDSGWFGSPSTSSYKNIYHGILNAAPTAAYTPQWLFNTSSSVAYPAIAPDAIGESVRNGHLSETGYADVSSMRFSRALVSGQYQGHVVRIPYENANLANGSFTLEWFFKTDGKVPSGDGINSYTFMYNSFAKVMINQSNGKLLTRLVKPDGTLSDNYPSVDVEVDDAAWHHYALVYDKAQGAFAAYIDYRKVVSGTLELITGTSTPFSFGGYGRQEQGFAGQLDDFRITRRALKANEFLTTRPIVSHDSLLAHFDGDLSTGQDAVLAPDGVGGTYGGGAAAPTFVDANRRIDLDGDGKTDHVSTKAISLDGGSVVWPHNSLLECRDFTFEWFAKYESLADNALLLRLGMASDDGTGLISWALYKPGNCLRLGVETSADGFWHNMSRSDKDFATGSAADIADGKWHHWALVAQSNPSATPANTTFRLYKDYEQVGTDLVFNKNGAGGVLAFPSTGTALSIGTGGARVKGLIDELRMTPSVLAPEHFMHRFPNGFSIEFQ